jgi:Alpha-L-fucosidase
MDFLVAFYCRMDKIRRTIGMMIRFQYIALLLTVVFWIAGLVKFVPIILLQWSESVDRVTTSFFMKATTTNHRNRSIKRYDALSNYTASTGSANQKQHSSISISSSTSSTTAKVQQHQQQQEANTSTSSPMRTTQSWEELEKRILPNWYDESKIGIFIHYGVYSVPSYKSEWFEKYWYEDHDPDYIRFVEQTEGTKSSSSFRYMEYASRLSALHYNPYDWAQLVAQSGAQYVVLTSKHHDGYCKLSQK